MTGTEVIAYLDDTRGDDMYTAVLEGMMESAAALGVRLVRFGYTPNAADEATGYDRLFSLIRAIHPDGLIFLGWTRAGAMYNRQQLLQQMSGIRLLSLGSEFPDIPSVLYRGDEHIGQMVRHLIRRHGYRRIAYMPPERSDTRIDAWREAMNAHGLPYPELEIADDAWGVTGAAARVTRFLEILLDERQLPLDAIVSSGQQETETLVAELARRRLRIPEDIALTGYVDTDFERYATPGITTIDYPWADMGRVACERMVAWIRTAQAPETVMLPGRILIRESCGCVSELVHQAAVGLVPSDEEDILSLSPDKRRDILAPLEEAFPYPSLSFDRLLDGLIRDITRIVPTEGSRAETVPREADPQESIVPEVNPNPDSVGGGFLDALSEQLALSPPSIRQARLETMVLRFRSAVMPWLVKNPILLRHTGDLFRRAQRMLLAEIAQSRGRAGIRAKNQMQAMQESTQALMTAHSKQGIRDALLDSLPLLQIPFCALVTFPERGRGDVLPAAAADRHDLTGEGWLMDIRHRRIEPMEAASPDQVMSRVMHSLQQCRLLQVLPLELSSKLEVFADPTSQRRQARTGSDTQNDVDWLGYVVFEPGPVDEQVYRAIASHLCSALENTSMAETLQANYSRMALQAFSEGQSDVIARALHLAGNAFNSVNASVQIMSQELGRSAIPDLFQAENVLAAMSREENPDSEAAMERMLRLLQLFRLLGQRVAQQRDTMRAHVDRVLDKAEWMDEIISNQQTVVTTARVEAKG